MSAARALMTFHYSMRWQDQAKELRLEIEAIESIEVTVGNHFLENRKAFGLFQLPLEASLIGIQGSGPLSTLILREPGKPNELHLLIVQQGPMSAKEMDFWTTFFRSRLGGDP